MKPLATLIILVAMLISVGCGKKAEEATPSTQSDPSLTASSSRSSGAMQSDEIANYYIEGLLHIAEAIERTKDEFSARDAAIIISKVNAKLEVLVAEVEKLSENDKMKLFADKQTELSAAQMRISTALQALSSKPHYLESISDEMHKLPEL